MNTLANFDEFGKRKQKEIRDLFDNCEYSDHYIASRLKVPLTEVRKFRKEHKALKRPLVKKANAKQLLKKNPELHQIGIMASTKYVTALRNTRRAISPLLDRLLEQVTDNLDRPITSREVLQLAQAVKIIQQTASEALGDTEQAILTLIDYEMVGSDQAGLLFEAIDESMLKFQQKTANILKNDLLNAASVDVNVEEVLEDLEDIGVDGLEYEIVYADEEE